MECENCEIIEKKKLLIFEDDVALVAFKQNPASLGHILIIPKNHYTIIEQIPEEELGHLFNLANKASVILFEGLNALGTNIIIQNGVSAGQKKPHVEINVIPRQEKDGLNFQWIPKQLTEDEMETAEVQLKEILEEKEVKTIEEQEKQEPEEIKQQEDKDNMMIKHLERVP